MTAAAGGYGWRGCLWPFGPPEDDTTRIAVGATWAEAMEREKAAADG